MNKIFIPLSFFKLRFRILHILPFFPNFQISKHPHAIWLSEPYACHRKVCYTCQCLILCKFFFSLWNLLHNLYRSVCMLTKLTTNLNSIWSSLAYFFLNLWQSFSHKKKNSVELGKISMFVQILWNQCCLLQRYWNK